MNQPVKKKPPGQADPNRAGVSHPTQPVQASNQPTIQNKQIGPSQTAGPRHGLQTGPVKPGQKVANQPGPQKSSVQKIGGPQSGPPPGSQSGPRMSQPNQKLENQVQIPKKGPTESRPTQSQPSQSQPPRSDPVKPQSQPKPPTQPRSIFSSIFGDDTPVTPAEQPKPVVKPVQQAGRSPPKPGVKPINTSQPAPTPVFQTMPKPMPRNSSGEKLPSKAEHIDEKSKNIPNVQSKATPQVRPNDYVDTSRVEPKKISAAPDLTKPKPLQAGINRPEPPANVMPKSIFDTSVSSEAKSISKSIFDSAVEKEENGQKLTSQNVGQKSSQVTESSIAPIGFVEVEF